MTTKNKERSLVLPKGLSNMEVLGELEKKKPDLSSFWRSWMRETGNNECIPGFGRKGNRNMEWHLRMRNGIKRGIFFLGEKQ